MTTLKDKLTEAAKEIEARKLARIAELEKENAKMKKVLKKLPEKEKFSEATEDILENMSNTEICEHLWKRCRAMESRDYYWFKQMSKVGSWYKKDWSDGQKDSMKPIIEKYWDSKETKKPKDPKKANPWK